MTAATAKTQVHCMVQRFSPFDLGLLVFIGIGWRCRYCGRAKQSMGRVEQIDGTVSVSDQR